MGSAFCPMKCEEHRHDLSWSILSEYISHGTKWVEVSDSFRRSILCTIYLFHISPSSCRQQQPECPELAHQCWTFRVSGPGMKREPNAD